MNNAITKSIIVKDKEKLNNILNDLFKKGILEYNNKDAKENLMVAIFYNEDFDLIELGTIRVNNYNLVSDLDKGYFESHRFAYDGRMTLGGLLKGLLGNPEPPKDS